MQEIFFFFILIKKREGGGEKRRGGRKQKKKSNKSRGPAGKTLKKHKIAFGDENKIDYKANGKECRSCELFGVCTTSKNGRHIIRMKENEDLKAKLEETYQQEEGQKLYKLRKEKVELPFGHMKGNLGAGQFLLRGKEGV